MVRLDIDRGTLLYLLSLSRNSLGWCNGPQGLLFRWYRRKCNHREEQIFVGPNMRSCTSIWSRTLLFCWINGGAEWCACILRDCSVVFSKEAIATSLGIFQYGLLWVPACGFVGPETHAIVSLDPLLCCAIVLLQCCWDLTQVHPASSAPS